MKIEVTQAHIDKGMRGICALCPIAFAIADVIPNTMILVDTVSTMLGDKKVATPDAARVFMSAFDAGRPVEPFVFELEV